LNANGNYVRKPACEAVPLDDEWLIFDLDGCTVTKVNATGALCWRELAAPRSVPALAEAVRAEYGADVPGVEDDVRAFVRELSARGLIRDAR